MVPNTPMVFNAMKLIGGYNILFMVPLSIVGESLGSSCNYVLGRIMNSVKHSVPGGEDSKKFLELKRIANEKLFILVLFAFIPLLGVIITSAAGFLKVSYKRFIVIFIVGRAIYYFITLNALL
ncbi:MAG: VTT domain-containing protein [Alphaproteobacteria bacterium]|nr:VTT domain-containing protein [Alphaproteobacteria bacterium]